ncbi:MAG: hypothetical protein JWO91_3933 [Acidobacteriaceae bacterium]|jgi:hypothetical protein|nr:hypothetical protein [Acidobacteriaceae bacterium]
MKTADKFAKFVSALIATGKLDIEKSKQILLREDSNGEFHVEAAGLSHVDALRFKTAMDAAGIPANFRLKQSHEL